MKLVTDTELLARFYGDDDELDHKEKFLRSYILNEGWKEKQGGKNSKAYSNPWQDKDNYEEYKEKKEKEVDEEDDDREDEMDNFESKYNFRYEEPNAATITSHARNVGEDETMRRKDSSRKLARERAQEKKQDLKKQRKDEIAKLKAMKREEIIEKLKKADHLSKGNLFSDKLLVERVQKELETEFIPDVYDKTMAKMFNEKYYEDEADQDGHEIEANKAIDLKLLQDQGDRVEPDAHEYMENDEKM